MSNAIFRWTYVTIIRQIFHVLHFFSVGHMLLSFVRRAAIGLYHVYKLHVVAYLESTEA